MSIIRQLARVANRIDSASTGTFLSKGDSTGDFTLVNYTDLSGRPTTLDSAALTTIVDSAYIQLRQTSGGSGGLDSAEITALVDSNYVVARSPSASSGFANYEYTATAGQTTFQDSDINGNVMSYTADGIFVFYNGVLIAPTTDYTASDGSSVVLTTGADSGSHVAISKWSIAGGSSGSGAAAWYGDRAIVAGGYGSSNSFTIDYFDITTLGNATDFGDLLEHNRTQAGVSDATYGLFAGGFITSSGSNYYGTTGFASGIEYVTISTAANSGDFGDLTVAREGLAGVSDVTYGVFGGGYASGTPNIIDYVTIATTGNAIDFGDLTQFTYYLASANDATYGLFAGGGGPFNTISYVTIASAGNASDFGDLTQARQNPQGAGNDTYGVFVGGQTNTENVNTMDYVTIQTTGNATDFGDLTSARHSASTTGNATRGVSAGGETPSAKVNNIDYFAFDTPANAVDFGDLTEARRSGAATSGSPS